MSQAPLAFQGRNPDVLTCIANLSNDEVFTPPELANQMLDTVERTWADTNSGASIWSDKTARFLDPFTKSGVFLREITKRLVEGLAKEIPDLEQRVDHILTRQVYGIAITELTSLLSRRSLYCSKWANGEHSIAKSFTTESGNIWFDRTRHTWDGAKCRFCKAPRLIFDRAEDLESHAYAFIHTDDIKSRIVELFGDDMLFDVVIGNPPYQLQSDGGTRDVPIYPRFVEKAKELDPRFLVMVTPSRWMAGGMWFDQFRDQMLNDRHLRVLVDYARMETVFPGVDFEGGVSYFLWDRDHEGQCEVTYHLGDEQVTAMRDLGEFDVFVRNSDAVRILRKVRAKGEPSITEIMATNNEFALVTNFSVYDEEPSKKKDVALHVIANNRRTIGWVSRESLPKGHALVDKWKVLIPKSYGERGVIPAQILGPVLLAAPPSASTQTYVFIYTDSQEEAESVASYTQTRFFRFMLSLRKITQHAAKPVYEWVPIQKWDRTWTDELLYRKYGLTADEVALIEKLIRPASAESDG